MTESSCCEHERWAVELQRQVAALTAEREHLVAMNAKWKRIAYALRDVASQAMDEWGKELEHK